MLRPPNARWLQALLALYTLMQGSPSDIAWEYMDQAVATAEHLGNPSLTGQVLLAKPGPTCNVANLNGLSKPATQALSLIGEEALADRAGVLNLLLWASYQCGRFADVVRLIPELEVVARRAEIMQPSYGVRSSSVLID